MEGEQNKVIKQNEQLKGPWTDADSAALVAKHNANPPPISGPEKNWLEEEDLKLIQKPTPTT